MLFGPKKTECFFGKGEITSFEYVPFQLGTVLNASLARAGETMKEWAETENLGVQAEASFQGIRKSDEAAKRARTGQYEM